MRTDTHKHTHTGTQARTYTHTHFISPLLPVTVWMEIITFCFEVTCLWVSADAEDKVPSAENPGLSEVLSFKPGLGHNIAMHASPNARIFFSPFLISTFLVHSTSFSLDFLALRMANTGSRVARGINKVILLVNTRD